MKGELELEMKTITTEYMMSSNAKKIDAKKYKEVLDAATTKYLREHSDATVYTSAIEKEGRTVVTSKPVEIRKTSKVATKKACKKSAKKKVKPKNTCSFRKTCKKPACERCVCKKGIVKCTCGFHWHRPEYKAARRMMSKKIK